MKMSLKEVLFALFLEQPTAEGSEILGMTCASDRA